MKNVDTKANTTKSANVTKTAKATTSKRVASAQAAAAKAAQAAQAAQAAAVAQEPQANDYHAKQEAMRAAFEAKGGKVTEAASSVIKSDNFSLYKVASYDTLSKDHGVKLGFFRGYTIAAFIASGYLNITDKGRIDINPKGGDYAMFNHLTRPNNSGKSSAISTACKTFAGFGAFSKDLRQFTVEGLNKVASSIEGKERYSTSLDIVRGMLDGLLKGGKVEVNGRTFNFVGVRATSQTTK